MKTNYKKIHLGGGTPTFFFLLKFRDLLNGIFSYYAIKAPQHEFSFEGHPNTTHAHLQSFTIWDLRVSLVFKITLRQSAKAIHREQPFHNVAKVTLREIGYTSIGHDLILGSISNS
jgi:oxygen-independent coproporphyrinogen-3 oxidase